MDAKQRPPILFDAKIVEPKVMTVGLMIPDATEAALKDRVAQCGIYLGDGFFCLHSLRVPKGHRRRGYGGMLLNEVLRRLRLIGKPGNRVYLEALPYGEEATDQKALFNFYERHGFRRTKGHPFEMTRSLGDV